MTLGKELTRVREWRGPRISGRVTQVIGLLIESIGPDSSVGELCYIYSKHQVAIPCQVVGFKEQRVLLMSLAEMGGIAPGCEVFPTDEVHGVPVSESLQGRILDALGNPIDDRGPLEPETFYPVTAAPPPPLKRKRIVDPLPTGIKAIDGMLTVGRGQRIGIFSGAGVGKSTLMGMIARKAHADINVIALIGERGREVREFIERELGSEGLCRSVVIVATSDQAALLRTKGAHVATAIAEYFRDLGKDVILMMDSISRFAMAQREIGLATGEPPTARGYTPSVFAKLPCLLERAGNGERGSITGIYTILTEGNDLSDPIADQMRSLLDGHILLSNDLAAAGHFPPIDVLGSLSRVMQGIAGEKHLEAAGKMRAILHTWKRAEELIHIGAYSSGSDRKIEEAKEKIGAIRKFLCQNEKEEFPFEWIVRELYETVSL